jgi:hypothetical protein
VLLADTHSKPRTHTCKNVSRFSLLLSWEEKFANTNISKTRVNLRKGLCGATHIYGAAYKCEGVGLWNKTISLTVYCSDKQERTKAYPDQYIYDQSGITFLLVSLCPFLSINNPLIKRNEIFHICIVLFHVRQFVPLSINRVPGLKFEAVHRRII